MTIIKDISMKTLLVLSTLLLSLYAQTAEMTAQEHMSIHTYSSRPTVQFQTKQIMHRIHKIDEKKLAELVEKETNETITREELTHQGEILYYDVHTKSYKLKVNALDGSIFNKVKKDD
jgi:uncharacterized membrane protein YkoI